MFVVIDKAFPDGCKAMALVAAVCLFAQHAAVAAAQQPTTAAPSAAQQPSAAEPGPATAEPAAKSATAEPDTAAPEPAIEPPVIEAAPATANAAVEPPLVDAGSPTTGEASEESSRSWFWRPPLSVSLGDGPERWTLTLFGFVEADYIFDSTRSYDDAIGGALVARSDTYAGTVGRSQFSVRNSRLGLMFAAPTLGGVKASAVLETDFFGNPTQRPTTATAEEAFFDSPVLRLRHAYLQLQNDYVDVLAGQTYTVFGWQNYFFPCSLEFLGLPNQVFSRNTQLRLAHTSASGESSASMWPLQR
jgi:hypothetical protein